METRKTAIRVVIVVIVVVVAAAVMDGARGGVAFGSKAGGGRHCVVVDF